MANRDLWIELDELANSMDIVWNWVKGHSGDPGNERADQLANLELIVSARYISLDTETRIRF